MKVNIPHQNTLPFHVNLVDRLLVQRHDDVNTHSVSSHLFPINSVVDVDNSDVVTHVKITSWLSSWFSEPHHIKGMIK